MLLRTAIALLAAWLLGVLGLYNVGRLIHVLLLVGPMLLLLGVLTALDVASTRRPDSRS